MRYRTAICGLGTWGWTLEGLMKVLLATVLTHISYTTSYWLVLEGAEQVNQEVLRMAHQHMPSHTQARKNLLGRDFLGC